MPSVINSDNGVVSGTAGLKSSADNSGVLDLQTNGTTAISISASQVVTFANQPAYTGGTANGVLYLNASKVLTSGTALAFDGTNLGIGTSSPASKLTVYGGEVQWGASSSLGFLGYTGGFPLIGSLGALPLAFYTNGSEKMRLDSSGNLGLGVTPSAWNTVTPVFQINRAALYGYLNEVSLSANYLFSSGDKYIASDFATRYNQASGQHRWYNAPSGTAGNAISFTQAMTLYTSGGLSVGNTFDLGAKTINLGQAVNPVGSLVGTFNFMGYTTSYGAGISSFIPTGSPGIDYQDIRFYTSAGPAYVSVERARITAGGILDLATGAGALGQIQFPATQVASANANTLDDYEEGSWTPIWTGNGGANNPTINYLEQTGRYIKIGKMVYIHFRVVVNSSSGGSGILRLSGLPFTTASGGNPGFISLNFSYGWSSSDVVLTFIPTVSSTTLDAYTQYAAFNSNTQTTVAALNAGGTIYVIAGGCYEAAS